MMAGGNKMKYEGDPSSPAVSLLNIKIFLNSVLSDTHTGARFFTVYVKFFYLQSPIKNIQYMRIPLKHFKEEIRDAYNIMYITENGYVYIEIC